MRKRSKVAKVGSKPRVHARVVAIGSPPRYAPTGPPSGVCSNVEKARHAAGGLNGGTRTVSRRACTRCANRVDRTVRGCGPRSSSGSRAPGLAFRLDRTLISLDQTLISLDRTLITPSVCAASRHCAQRSQRHVLLSCRHVRCRLPARCPWYRLGLSLVLCRPRAHRVGSPTRRQV